MRPNKKKCNFSKYKNATKIKFADVMLVWAAECFCKYQKMSKDGTAEQFQIIRPNLLSGLGSCNRRNYLWRSEAPPPLPYRPTHTEGGRFHDIINNDREDDVFEDHVVEATEKCSSYSRDCSVKVGRKAEVAWLRPPILDSKESSM